MTDRWTLEEVAEKADSEGGLFDLAYWGLKAAVVPEEIVDDWLTIESAVLAADRIQDKLDGVSQ